MAGSNFKWGQLCVGLVGNVSITSDSQVANELVGFGRLEPFRKPRVRKFSSESRSHLEALELIEGSTVL